MKRVLWIVAALAVAATAVALSFPRIRPDGRAVGVPSGSPFPAQVTGSKAGPTVTPGATTSPGATASPTGDAQPTPSPTGSAPSPRKGTCPDPRFCPAYALLAGRWPRTQGRIEIRYLVNSSGQSWLSEEELIGAIQAAARTWEAAHPELRLTFAGVTTELPMAQDGRSVIAWAALGPNDLARTTVAPDRRGVIRDVDTQLNSVFPFRWFPCRQRDGSCTKVEGEGTPNYYDVQALMTHEFGHWLSLKSLDGADAVALTMYYYGRPWERHRSTLGLGDVLGVRAAYPCSRCDDPVIYAP